MKRAEAEFVWCGVGGLTAMCCYLVFPGRPVSIVVILLFAAIRAYGLIRSKGER